MNGLQKILKIFYRHFTFPRTRDRENRDKWLRILQRADPKKPHLYLEPRPHSRVCSVHFVDGRPTQDHPCPELELGHHKFERIPAKRSKRRTSSPKPTCVDAISLDCSETDTNTGSHQSSAVQTLNAFCFFLIMLVLNIFSQLQETRADLIKTTEALARLRLKNRMLRSKLNMLTGKIREKSHVDKYVNTDADAKFFTGFPSVKIIHAIYALCRKHVNRRWQGKIRFSNSKFSSQRRTKLLGIDEFFLTLVRIRLGLLNRHLAKMFDISTGLVSQIFTTWLCSLDIVLSKLVYWPSKFSVKVTSPVRYRCVPGLRAIIDCSEIFLETPKDPKLQCATWSDYKHHNT